MHHFPIAPAGAVVATCALPPPPPTPPPPTIQEYKQKILALLSSKASVPLSFLSAQLIDSPSSAGEEISFYRKTDRGGLATDVLKGVGHLWLPTGFRHDEHDVGLILAVNITIDWILYLSIEYTIDPAFWEHFICEERQQRGATEQPEVHVD